MQGLWLALIACPVSITFVHFRFTMPNSSELTPYSQEWLAATFTKQIFGRRQTLEPPKFRSIVQAVRASMYVDKITRKTSQAPVDVSPASQMLQVYIQLFS